jgi:uncharacterized protein YcbK (DUF882 family)
VGDLSPHFSLSEFACRGLARKGHPRHPTPVSADLLESLERLRELAGGRPLLILSGHRCPVWNRSVGGATRSQHLLGTAADIPRGYSTVAQARVAGFGGIGRRGVWAVHVDVRPYHAEWLY